MKKAFYIFAAVSAIVLAAACAKEQQPEQVTPIEPQEEELVTYTFTASAQSEVVEDGDEEVRSTLSNGGAFTWAVDDQFKIWNTSTNSYVTFSVTEINDDGTVHISGTAAAGAVWGNAIYPASRAAGTGNTVDYTSTTTAGPILVGRVDGQVVYFYYLGAVMNITVNSVPDTPVSLTVTANSNVFGSRTFSWVENKPVLGGSGSQASVTVPFNASGITSVPVPNVSYAGFTITVDNAAGRHLYKKTTANTFDLTSKKLLPMPALTYAAPSGYYVKTVSSSGYWDKAEVRMIKTSATSYGVYENADGNSTYYIFDEYNRDQPTTAYSATGIARGPFVTGNSEWGLVGDVNGNNWTPSNPVAMQYEGNWHYVKNITFDNISDTGDGPYCHFLIAKGSSWDTIEKFCQADIYPAGSATTTYNGSYDIYAHNIVADTEYDFFFNISSHEIKLYLSSDNYDPNEESGIWSISFDSSTGTATHSRYGNNAEKPFYKEEFPTDNFCIAGGFNSWGTSNVFTYNGNMSWTLEGLTVASAGTYEYKLRNAGASDYWFGSDTWADLYGTLNSSTGGNCSVTLGAGTYNVYANATQDWNIRLMFVKQ